VNHGVHSLEPFLVHARVPEVAPQHAQVPVVLQILEAVRAVEHAVENADRPPHARSWRTSTEPM